MNWRECRGLSWVHNVASGDYFTGKWKRTVRKKGLWGKGKVGTIVFSIASV